MKEFSEEELTKNNGKNGMPALVSITIKKFQLGRQKSYESS